LHLAALHAGRHVLEGTSRRLRARGLIQVLLRDLAHVALLLDFAIRTRTARRLVGHPATFARRKGLAIVGSIVVRATPLPLASLVARLQVRGLLTRLGLAANAIAARHCLRALTRETQGASSLAEFPLLAVFVRTRALLALPNAMVALVRGSVLARLGAIIILVGREGAPRVILRLARLALIRGVGEVALVSLRKRGACAGASRVVCTAPHTAWYTLSDSGIANVAGVASCLVLGRATDRRICRITAFVASHLAAIIAHVEARAAPTTILVRPDAGLA
jgi:hypothetical protein